MIEPAHLDFENFVAIEDYILITAHSTCPPATWPWGPWDCGARRPGARAF
jgi:hypothetical protein